MPGTVKSELLPDADRLHKCDGQEKVCEIQHLPLDKSHFITGVWSFLADEPLQHLLNFNIGSRAVLAKQISLPDIICCPGRKIADAV